MVDPEIKYADDDTLSIERLMEMRFPAILIGLGLGILLSFITSRFEELLATDIRVAFFLPFIVYMADAVGTQTQSIYVRDLRTGKASFKSYLIKETFLGILLGIMSSAIVGLIVIIWFKSSALAGAVALSTFGAIAVAPLVALLTSEIFQLEHTDPAVEAGPIATVIQDTLSVLIYGLVASAVLL